MKPELSIIVVTWNARKYVQECLASLSHQELTVDAEIIVVDNASSDGTPDMVRNEFPQCVLVENPDNAGFAKANNIGIQKARGEYICLVNSDVNAPSRCLQTIYEFMEKHRSIGVVAPRMITPQGSVGRSYMRFPTLWNTLCSALLLGRISKRSALLGGFLMTDFNNERTAEVDVLNGWFLVIRRKALEQVGPLDETFFMYGEDIDWCYRFHKAGWKRVYLSDASALHYGGASSKVQAIGFYIQMHRANLQYWKKYHSSASVMGFRLTMILHQLIRALGHSLVYMLGGCKQTEAFGKVKRSAVCIAWLVGLREV